MNTDKILALVQALDTQDASISEVAWKELVVLGADVAPHLIAAYPSFKKWQGRVSLVYHSVRYARSSDDAFKLGLAALQDRATLVRYRACGLLAYSLRADALPHLNGLLSHKVFRPRWNRVNVL